MTHGGVEVVLGAPHLVEGEEVCLLNALIQEEEEEVLFQKSKMAQDHHPPLVWLFLALASVDSEDAVYTKAVVSPG